MRSNEILKNIGWSAGILVVGISVASFLTQGVLMLKDRMSGSQEASAAVMATDTGASASQQAADPVVPVNPKNLDLNGGASVPLDASVFASSSVKQYSFPDGSSMPRITAGAYLAADLNTGEIIVEGGKSVVAPTASVTKLMTALLAYEKMDMQQVTTVSRQAYDVFGSEGELQVGEKIKLYDLMHPLLMESSNDGAEVIAEAYPGGQDVFMETMNRRAQQLGMTSTYYEDPSGLDPKNVSSVEDEMKLGRYIWQHEPVIWDMTMVRQYAILGHQWLNRNAFLKYDTFMGGKNGYIDQSKKTMVALFDAPMSKGGNRQVIVVLLRSDDREGDGVKILNYLKGHAVYQAS